MIRSLKILVLALAVSVTASVPALASAEGDFTASSYPAHVVGGDVASNDFFESLGMKLECTSDTFTGTLEESSSGLTVTEAGCTLGGNPATTTMNGCKWSWSHAGEAIFHKNLVCPAGKVKEIHAYTSASHTTLNCRITIFPEEGLESVTAENEAGGILLSGTVEGINGQSHGACSFGLTISFSNGISSESVTISASGGKKLDIG